MVASLAEAMSPNVPPEAFLKHYRAIRDATRSKEDAVMALARTKKAAKGDGIDLDALKDLERLAKLDDDEAEVRLRHMHQYAVWANLPIGTQLDAFGQHQIPKPKQKAEAEHQQWTASDSGYRAGRSGRPRDDNPHEPGTEAHVSWTNGWLAGQRQIADAMADGASELPTPTARRRGRRQGSRNRVNGAATAPH